MAFCGLGLDISVSNPLLVMSDPHNNLASNKNLHYVLIGALLLVLTVVTVWTSTFSFSIGVSVGIALIIATVKGSLVASYFMHLITENKLILIILFFTVIFFIALIFLPLSDTMNTVGSPNVY